MNNDRSLVGTQLGKYRIQDEIGRGGMSTVYRGYDPNLDRHVAVKVLAPHLAWQQNSVERFLREARAAARLEHPNIVHIYDVGQEGGWYYYVMEYLAGETLTNLVQRQGPLAPKQVMSILRPLADALDFAHHNGLVHRDIKPSNVVVGRAGRVTLTDFGIARAVQDSGLTATGMVIGTPEYLSPEQAQGQVADARSDQYSLAVVAYQMLVGGVPFYADNTAALMFKIAFEPPPPVRGTRQDLPVQVEYVLGKALAKAPADRYPSVRAFADDLERAMAGQPVKALPPRPVTPPPESPTVLVGAAGVAAAGAVPGGPAQAPPAGGPAGAGAAVGPQPARRRVPVGIWVVGALALILLAAGLVMALGGIGGPPPPAPQTEATAVAMAQTAVAQTATAQEPGPSPLPGPSATPAPPTVESRIPAPTLSPAVTSVPPTTEDTETPPSATRQATSTAADTATSPPTPSPTATTAAPTSTQSPTPTATEAPAKLAPTVTAPPTRVSGQFAAPVLLGPQDGDAFTTQDTVVLSWQPVGQLPPEVYYEVVVTFSPIAAPADTWKDETPWTRESRWTLSEHDYLAKDSVG